MNVNELCAQIGDELSPTMVAQAKALRIEWLQAYNQLKSTPGGGYRHAEALEIAEQCLEILDTIIAAAPSIN